MDEKSKADDRSEQTDEPQPLGVLHLRRQDWSGNVPDALPGHFPKTRAETPPMPIATGRRARAGGRERATLAGRRGFWNACLWTSGGGYETAETAEARKIRGICWDDVFRAFSATPRLPRFRQECVPMGLRQ